MVFARRGIVPEAASAYFLPKLVGVAKALEWCMTGRVFPATEAEGTGLFNYLLPYLPHAPYEYLCSNLRAFAAALLMLRAGDSEEEVYPKALEIAEEIVENCSPSSVTLSKFMLWKQLDVSLVATMLVATPS